MIITPIIGNSGGIEVTGEIHERCLEILIGEHLPNVEYCQFKDFKLNVSFTVSNFPKVNFRFINGKIHSRTFSVVNCGTVILEGGELDVMNFLVSNSTGLEMTGVHGKIEAITVRNTAKKIIDCNCV